MGDSISEGTIEEFVKRKCTYHLVNLVKILNSLTQFLNQLDPGDFVNADEIVARIETDKVTVDITAPKAGVIKEYLADVGDTVDVGADFYVLDTDATAGSAAPAQPATPAAPKAEAPPAQAPPKAAPEPPKAAAAPPTPPPVTPQKAPAAAAGAGGSA